MKRLLLVALLALLPVSALPARADDLTDSNRFLCAAVQATMCVEDGDCATHLPWTLNVPEFIEVDLAARRLATTAASSEQRATAIEHLSRSDGVIVFHGYERGRAFSWVIDERSGRVTIAVATDGGAVAVFGTCTPTAAGRAAP